MNIRKQKIILASGSPRRKELLELMGLEFTIHPAKGEEKVITTEPQDVVMQLSKQKALEVSAFYGAGTVIIGADTVVSVNGKILGKPANREDAFNMISSIRNGCHSVFTGVTIISKKDGTDDLINCFSEETKVHVYDMTDEEIYGYIDTKDPMDKAGAYGIQGPFAEFIKGIEGDYNNVVGLPISRMMYELKKM